MELGDLGVAAWGGGCGGVPVNEKEVSGEFCFVTAVFVGWEESFDVETFGGGCDSVLSREGGNCGIGN